MRPSVATDLEKELRNVGRRLRSRVQRLRGNGEEAAMLWAWAIPGWSTKDELRLLYRATRRAAGPGDVAEIGSWKGRSTTVLSRALQDAGETAARVWAIDHHVGSDEEEHREILAHEHSTLDAFCANIRAAGAGDRVDPLVMSSTDAARELARREVTLRMVFIDGAHDEPSVRADIRAFLPLVRRVGLVALHDCTAVGAAFPGVWRAYQAELEGRVEVVEHVDALLVARLR